MSAHICYVYSNMFAIYIYVMQNYIRIVYILDNIIIKEYQIYRNRKMYKNHEAI